MSHLVGKADLTEQSIRWPAKLTGYPPSQVAQLPIQLCPVPVAAGRPAEHQQDPNSLGCCTIPQPLVSQGVWNCLGCQPVTVCTDICSILLLPAANMCQHQHVPRTRMALLWTGRVVAMPGLTRVQVLNLRWLVQASRVPALCLGASPVQVWSGSHLERSRPCV